MVGPNMKGHQSAERVQQPLSAQQEGKKKTKWKQEEGG